MKNWEKLDADKVVLMKTHYTKGRAGHKIKYIVIHHNAGTLSTEGCYNVWQSRPASAHYQVESDGVIGQLVWDSDMAWHAGNKTANLESIGIEHANNNSNPWTVSAATLENGAHLVAAICRKFGLGAPQWGVNVFPHSHFAATSCPGELKASQRIEYMDRAAYWYEAMSGKPSKPAKPSTGVDIDALARAVIRGEYGNGAERKRRLGANYAKVQARVNQLLGAKPAAGVDVDALARAVIRGEYGNGAERKRRLGANYAKVQARVNQLLGG